MNKVFFVLMYSVLLFVLCSCSVPSIIYKKESIYQNDLDQFMNEYFKDLEANNIDHLLRGCRGNGNNIIGFECYYISKHEFKIAEAREFIVQHAENFLKKVNQDDALSSYLTCHPLMLKDVFLCFIFKEDWAINLQIDRGIQQKPYVSLVLVRDNTIFYVAFDEETNSSQLIHKETFEEAKFILKRKDLKETPYITESPIA